VIVIVIVLLGICLWVWRVMITVFVFVCVVVVMVVVMVVFIGGVLIIVARKDWNPVGFLEGGKALDALERPRRVSLSDHGVGRQFKIRWHVLVFHSIAGGVDVRVSLKGAPSAPSFVFQGCCFVGPVKGFFQGKRPFSFFGGEQKIGTSLAHGCGYSCLS
jgi:hypothetical protein